MSKNFDTSLVTPINLSALGSLLAGYPNFSTVSQLLAGFAFGFDVGYRWPEFLRIFVQRLIIRKSFVKQALCYTS
jgi:hypothetical protein